MLNDLRYTLRTLRRSPGFAASAILALALGIGANTAVFSVVYSVLLKPLPYPEADRLVQLYETNRAQGIDRGALSPGTFLDWQVRSRVFDSMAAYSTPGDALWSFKDGYEVVRLSRVTPALFTVLRTMPVLGRAFAPDADPLPAVPEVMISYGLWQRRFGGRDIIGEAVSIEGRVQAQIIGVMPRGFDFPGSTDAWANVGLRGPVAPARRSQRFFQGIGRIAAAQSVESARRELAGVSAQLEGEYPDSNRGWTGDLEPLHDVSSREVKPALLALLGAVTGVLLIGCANVANLLLARASARRREMAVRLALGAGAGRLARQCFIEAVVLAACGAATGVVAGQWLARGLIRVAPPQISRLPDASTAPLLWFAAAAGLACAVAIGVAPALQAWRVEIYGEIRPDGRGVTGQGARVRRFLIGSEVAVVALLLIGATLLMRTFVKLRGVDLGFATRQVLSVETRWPTSRFPPSPGVRPWPRVQRAVDGLIAAVMSVPGVDAAGLVTDLPLTGAAFAGRTWRADARGASGLEPPTSPGDHAKADVTVVTAGYFPAMGIPFLRGRNFVDADRFSDEQLNDSTLPRAGVAVVNAALVERFFPNEDPIGRSLVLRDAEEFGALRTIVGVVANVRQRAVTDSAVPAVYLPHAQEPDVLRPTIAVRSALPPQAVAGAIREALRTYDPHLLVLRIRPMDEIVSGALSAPRFNLLLLVSFATVALLLAGVGIYGVLAYLVTQRTREIGIRMALGARAADVLRLVLREGMTPVALGGIAGMLAAVLATRALRSMLFGVTPLDPVSFAVAPAVLATVALLACYLPARRATRVDPLVALREE
jgi:putative ABC transport system permease protein